MWAMLIVCVLVGVLTFYQIFSQGFFSCVIMAVLCLVAALVAFNYYEVLAEMLADLGMAGFGPQAICLMALFILTLFILRLLADRLIRGNMNFPVLIDRAGSAVFGLIASLIVVGMILLSYQHLSIPARFLGFDRISDLSRPQQTGGLFPKADAFVVGLVGRASDYSFSGGKRFSQHHPRFLSELYLNRLALSPGSRAEAGKDAIVSVQVRRIDANVMEAETRQLIAPPPGETFLVVSMTLKLGTGRKGNLGTRDVDGNTRFVLGNVRLAGFNQADDGPGLDRYPIGLFDSDRDTVEKIGLDEGLALSREQTQIDLLFEWPEDIKKMPLRYVEFKRTARKIIPRVETSQPSPPANGQ